MISTITVSYITSFNTAKHLVTQCTLYTWSLF